MMNTRSSRRKNRWVGVASLSVVSLFAAGCGGSAADSGPVEITYWSWLPGAQDVVDRFEEEHPDIQVTVENVGVATDEYTKIQNAVDAGSGGPDVAHMTYDVIPGFALTGALADLNEFGGEGTESLFLPAVHDLVTIDEGMYAAPLDFGPGVMYYREDVLDEHGLEVPRTWEDFRAAAEVVAAAGTDQRLTFADPGLADAAYMAMWQLGADPWSVEGEQLTLNLLNDDVEQWADYWGSLHADGLLLEATMGSDEWFKQINDGTIATWLVGAWGLQALVGNAPESEGLWRVAPLPSWDGKPASGQFGGSASVVLEQSEHREAATTFALWMNSDPAAVEIHREYGLLPAAAAVWEDPDFLDEEISYLGGQQARQIFEESADSTTPGWEWLPFQTYVNGIYPDTVGQSIAGQEATLMSGFEQWQERIAEYAESQGFTVTVE